MSLAVGSWRAPSRSRRTSRTPSRSSPSASFGQPTDVVSDPADPDRLLISELGGKVVMVDHGTRAQVLDLAAAGLLHSGPATGLFSLAPAPDFHTSGHLFVAYTRAPTTDDPDAEYDLQVDRFTLGDAGVDLDSRVPLLEVPMDEELVHFGSQLQFGPDGMLYISVGDGSEAADTLEAAQSLDDLHGKLLRIDPSGSIPPDNPFAGATPGLDAIWSYGLRNPWRFSFDRSTGDLWIADVGEAVWEEIDYGAAPNGGRGVNFGWDCREGPVAFEPDGCAGPFTDPVFAYSHAGGHGSITGGYVVRDPSLGDLYGRYLYGDSVSGQVRSVNPSAPGGPDDRLEFDFDTPISFGQDSCGRLYVTSLHGAVDRIAGPAGAGAPDCSPTTPDDPPDPPVAVCAGRAATVAGTAGTAGEDVIVAGAGADRLRGRGGDDLICAGRGNDVLRGGGGNDVLRGGPGRDRCHGGAGANRERSC